MFVSESDVYVSAVLGVSRRLVDEGQLSWVGHRRFLRLRHARPKKTVVCWN